MSKIGYEDTLNTPEHSPLKAKEEKTRVGKMLDFYTFGLSGAAGDAIKKRKAKRADSEPDPVKVARKEGRKERKNLRQTNKDAKKLVRQEKRATNRETRAAKVKVMQDKRTQALKDRLAKKNKK